MPRICDDFCAKSLADKSREKSRRGHNFKEAETPVRRTKGHLALLYTAHDRWTDGDGPSDGASDYYVEPVAVGHRHGLTVVVSKLHCSATLNI